MSPSEFEKYYKTISNTELLAILENPGDYQAEAIEAAKKEFANRNLSDIAIQEARKPLHEKKIKEEKQKEKVKAIEDKVKNSWTVFFEAINPIQQGIPTTERTIRAIVIVFSTIFLYEVIAEYGIIMDVIKRFELYSYLNALFILFPYIILPVSLLMFWKRKPIGWILLCIFLTLSVTVALWSFVFDLLRSSDSFYDFFPGPSMSTLVIQMLFLAGTLYIICRRNIRAIYSITSQTAAISIGAGFAFTFLGLLFVTY